MYASLETQGLRREGPALLLQSPRRQQQQQQQQQHRQQKKGEGNDRNKSNRQSCRGFSPVTAQLCATPEKKKKNGSNSNNTHGTVTKKRLPTCRRNRRLSPPAAASPLPPQQARPARHRPRSLPGPRASPAPASPARPAEPSLWLAASAAAAAARWRPHQKREGPRRHLAASRDPPGGHGHGFRVLSVTVTEAKKRMRGSPY